MNEPALSAATANGPETRQPTPLNFPGLPALEHYVRQGRCALFVGAGLSVGAGLPTWVELMRRLMPHATPLAVAPKVLAGLEQILREYPDTDDDQRRAVQARTARQFRKTLGDRRFTALFPADAGQPSDSGAAAHYDFDAALSRLRREHSIQRELQRLLNKERYAEIAGFCRDLLGRERFHALVRKHLRVRGDTPATHRAIVRTPYACIVTTNFDTLLEDAYGQHDPRGLPKAPTGSELAHQGTLLLDAAFFILKAHGDLEDPASIIFTSEDYRRVIHSNPAFNAMMTSILLGHAVLFVGYSLSDTNFRLLLDNQLTIFNENVPPRYALMHDVGTAEREILWRTARLRVFSYPPGEHELVERFLSRLADRCADPKEPQTRSTAGHAAPIRRATLGRPEAVRTVTLGVRGLGEHIVLDLAEHAAGQLPQRLWSGGGIRPDWPRLQRELRTISRSLRAELGLVTTVGAHLQALLPDDLLRVLNRVDPGRIVTLALSPETEVLPWEWLIVDGTPLSLRNPVVRQAVGIGEKARGFRFVGTPLRALIVGDAGLGDEGRSGGHLPGASLEAKDVARVIQEQHPENLVTVLEREHARYGRLVEEVETGDYDIIHFAGHAHVEETESVLILWDGQVSSSELASLLNRRPPALLVLNSHNTAFFLGGLTAPDRSTADLFGPGSGVVLPPTGGFTTLASRSGVSAFVGYLGTLEDASAARFSTTLYGWLLGGETFAIALHHARRATTSLADATGLLYAGSGYPHLRLSARPGPENRL